MSLRISAGVFLALVVAVSSLVSAAGWQGPTLSAGAEHGGNPAVGVAVARVPLQEPVPPAQPVQEPGQTEIHASQIAAIDGYASRVMGDWKVPGMAIAIVRDDRVLLAKGYGLRRLGSSEAVDADTLFAIASNSKAFTTTALAILVDQGKLQWDDRVSDYLPEFQLPGAFESRELTVRDLVCHRSGLDTFSGDLLWYDTTHSVDEILRRVRHLKPVSSFRSRYGYQNLMFIAAGRIVERVSGASWGDFIRQNLLDPLKMERTTTSIREERENVASPHNESQGKGLRVLPQGNVDNSWGACGLNSSAGDLAQWMRLQLGRGTLEGRQIFSARQSRELWQPQTLMPISERGEQIYPSRHFMAYGLGFVLNDLEGRKVVSHGGGLDGMISQLALVPEENLGVVVLTNSESPASRIIRDRVLDVFLGVRDLRDWNAEALVLEEEGKKGEAAKEAAVDAARIPDSVPGLPLGNFAGRYGDALYGDAEVVLEGGRLVLRLVPAPNFVADLEHWHLNTFRIRWRETVKYNFPRGFVNFTLGVDGQPEKLVIDQPNSDFWFYELDLKRKPAGLNP